MKMEVVMCHSHLMSMLLQPEMLQHAVEKYEAFTPDVDNEGFNGYMETHVTFHIKNLDTFTELWNKAYRLPSDRSEWYYKIKNATLA